MILLYTIVSFTNVVLHIFRNILVIKSSKVSASFWNCICYTFSTVVVKFIAETDLWIAITVQAATNFIGCYVGMLAYEWWEKLTKKSKEAKR